MTMPDAADAPDISTWITAAAVLFVGIVVVASVAGVMTGVVEVGGADEEPITPSTSGSQLESDAVTNLSLVDSTGNAVAFGDGHGRIAADIDHPNAPRSYSLWVSLAENASQFRDYRALSADGGNVTLTLSGGDWRACMAESGAPTCVNASVADPTALHNVVLVQNSTHVRVDINGTTQNSSLIDESGSVEAADDWWGTVEDIRVFETGLTDAQTTSLYGDPLQPMADQAARLMLDAGSGSDVRVFYDTTDATLAGNYRWTSGLAGSQIASDQYDLDSDDGIVTAVGGSRFEALPIAYASYEQDADPLAVPIGPISGALSMGSVLVLVIVAAQLLGVINLTGRNTRR